MSSHRPKAIVYRGPASSRGCPESAADLLESSEYDFEIVFAGPNEDVDVTQATLSDAAIYVQPGGGDLDPAWNHMKRYAPAIKQYVQNGGRYFGICVGAYLAGHSPGLGILVRGIDTDSEISQRGSQVRNDADTVIQVDWQFQDGSAQKKRWLYFQDGAMIQVPRAREGEEEVRVLGRYSKTQNVAACVVRCGRGWVGVCGPHPEADEEWYEDEELENPDGVKFDIGHDLVEAIMEAS